MYSVHPHGYIWHISKHCIPISYTDTQFTALLLRRRRIFVRFVSHVGIVVLRLIRAAQCFQHNGISGVDLCTASPAHTHKKRLDLLTTPRGDTKKLWPCVNNYILTLTLPVVIQPSLTIYLFTIH